ncbi:MAG: DNA polymerase IV [Dehalococcoidia bacterium]
MARTILHVDLDAFYVGVEVARRPELAGKPVVVAGSSAHRGVVLSASYEARAFQIDSGMPSGRAVRLCPQATFVPPDFKAYRQASEAFMAVLKDYSPRVEPTSLDEAYIDYTGCEPIHGPARAAAEALRQRVREAISVRASVGIGPSRVVAKVASAAAKPDGVLEIAPGGEAAFFAPLSIRKLPGIGPKAQQRLEAIGIQTLGQLATLGDDFLARNLGNYGAELKLRAQGIDAGSIHEGRPANRSVSRSETFPADTRDPAYLRPILQRQAQSLAEDVRGQGKRARTVTLQLKYADFVSISRSVTLAQATGSEDVIFGAADALLARELEHDPREIRLIGTHLGNLVDGAQLDLFGDEGERENLAGVLASLRQRFGKDAVRRGLVEDHRSEWE